MVAKCANPGCNVAFRYLREGKLFLLDIARASRHEGTHQRLEYFWLCDRCSATMKVFINESGEAVISGLIGAGPQPRFATGGVEPGGKENGIFPS